MIRLKNKTNLITKGKIDVEIFPELVSFPIKNKYYWKIYYWKNTKSFLENTPFNSKEKDIMAAFISSSYKNNQPQSLLGELHFVKNKWNPQIVNHEVMHGIFRLIHDFYPNKVSMFTKCNKCVYGNLEEHMCELSSQVTSNVLKFLKEANKK